jgi:hypothetical protein
LRNFFRRRCPNLNRVLLVESGSRFILEKYIAANCPNASIDLVTCYAGAPKDFNGPIFRVQDYTTPEARQALYQELKRNSYDCIGILCTGEPIMTKWKWMLAAQVPAKAFVINENADWFWLQYANWRNIWGFIAYRAGMSGAGAVTTPLRLLLFPFALAYLLFYAASLHLRKALR